MKRVFLDTETSGLTEKHGIVQLAAIVEIDGKVVDRFNLECAPYPATKEAEGDRVDPASLAIHGRTIEQVRAYADPREVHAAFVAFLGAHVSKFDKADKAFLLAYNARFDADMLRAWFTKAGDTYFGSWFWTPPVDIMSLAADRLIARRPSMPNFKLGTVCAEVGITLANAHDAMADVEAARGLYHWTRSLAVAA